MSIILRLGPVAVRLQDLLIPNDSFRIWDWKLDSFISTAPNINTDITITFHTNVILNNKALTLLKDDVNGFYNHQVFICRANDNLLFRLFDRIESKEVLSYLISQDWKHISIIEDTTKTDANYSFEYLGMIMPYTFLKKEILTFHGVLMEYNGSGIIFSANSGVGKTTHARLWRDYKHAFIINGDKSACYKRDGVWTGFGMPWCGTSGEYMNREVPIKALVLIERGETNQVRKLNPIEAFKRLLEHAQYPSWDIELSSIALDLLNDFIERIPVYVLKCTIDTEAVDVLANELFQ